MSEQQKPLFGLLNVNKPAGSTSRRVVDHVQRLVRPAKAGHAGTLDPLATGVLMIAVGPATRLIHYVQQMPKRYTGTFLLGRSSDTEDIEGQVIELDSPCEPTLDEILEAAKCLTGQIDQRPPAFSALKIEGHRAYKLARAGEKVELQSRRITIYQLEVKRYDYPELTLEVECSSGTYIRSLGRDLAESLGTAAVMSALVRTAIGDFHLDDALDMEAITSESLLEKLLPPVRAVASLPSVRLNRDELQETSNGRSIKKEAPAGAKEIAGLDESGNLVSILSPMGEGLLRPVRNFPAG